MSTYLYAVDDLHTAAKTATNKLGGYFEEHFANAQWIYVRALRTYRPGRTTFPRYLKFKLKTQLVEMHRREHRQRHGNRPNRTPVLNQIILRDRPEPTTFVDRITDDDDLLVMRKALSLAVRQPANKVQHSLRIYLRKKLGWSIDRVAESFNEIRRALG